jgi:hypothetical protein
MTELWNNLVQALAFVRDFIWGKLESIGAYLWTRMTELWNNLLQAFTTVKDFLWGAIVAAQNFIVSKLTGIGEFIIAGLTPYFNAISSAFTVFGDWLKIHVLDPWSDWLKQWVDRFVDFATTIAQQLKDKFSLMQREIWKWTTEQTPTILTLLKFSVTQDIFGEIKWISGQASSYSTSGYDGFLSFIETLKTTSPDQMLPVMMKFFKSQSALRYDAVTWTQSLQMNPALRGLDFSELFAHGEWQLLLAGVATGFGMGMVSMVINKPLAYWFNSVIRPEILDANTLQIAYLREEITDADVKWGLEHWGFDDRKIETIKKTWKWIPGPSDLIRLAVRESFTPPLVLDYESADYKKWMKKQGAEDWSDMFWHAHWVLPSISELSEMVHRNVIDDETWKKFVTLNDYWPPMVDNFKKIIYTPFTRVDIRRMYNSGVIDEEGVTRAYKDIGYDEEKAAKLTEFTKALKTGTAKDLTLSMIVKSFKQGNTSRDAALEMIVDLGYEEDEADFILSLYEQQTKEESRELSQSKFDAMFQLGLIDREELKRNLIALNYSTEASENLVKIEEAKRDGKITLLPLGTLREALRRKILDPTDFTTRAKRLGYQDDEIEIVIALEEARVAA